MLNSEYFNFIPSSKCCYITPYIDVLPFAKLSIYLAIIDAAGKNMIPNEYAILINSINITSSGIICTSPYPVVSQLNIQNNDNPNELYFVIISQFCKVAFAQFFSIDPLNDFNITSLNMIELNNFTNYNDINFRDIKSIYIDGKTKYNDNQREIIHTTNYE